MIRFWPDDSAKCNASCPLAIRHHLFYFPPSALWSSDASGKSSRSKTVRAHQTYRIESKICHGATTNNREKGNGNYRGKGRDHCMEIKSPETQGWTASPIKEFAPLRNARFDYQKTSEHVRDVERGEKERSTPWKATRYFAGAICCCDGRRVSKSRTATRDHVRGFYVAVPLFRTKGRAIAVA